MMVIGVKWMVNENAKFSEKIKNNKKELGIEIKKI